MTTDPYNLSKPVNVAMLSLHSSPVGALGTKDTGGMSTYVLETARQLVKKGCAVDIFTRKTGPESPAVLPLGPGIRLVHLTAGVHRPIPKTALVDLKNDFMSAFHEFRKKSPVAYDLIHSHYWLSGLVGRPLSEKIQVPHCITFHTLAKFKNNTGDGDPEPAVRIDHETRLIHGCSRVIVGTQEEKTAAVRHYKAAPERVGVVPGGVDLDRFRIIPGNQARNLLGIPPSSWVILYAGRFDPLKGIDTIIESIGSLVYDCPLRRPVILLLVGGDGEGRENERLKAAADKAGVREHVRFTGRADHADMPLYYNAADVLVTASSYESFGLVGLEALACGTPVVSTPTGGMPCVIHQGRNGYVTGKRSAIELADALAHVLEGKGNGYFNARGIRDTVRSFTWSKTTEKLLREYRFAGMEVWNQLSGVDQ